MLTIVPSGKVSDTPDNKSASGMGLPDAVSSAVTGRNIEVVLHVTGSPDR